MVFIRNMANHGIEILEDNYKNICQILCQLKISKEKLELIKNKFIYNINSVRRYENIMDMKELLKVLEKRGAISHNNIAKLYDIAEMVDDKSKQIIGKHLNNQSYLLSKAPIVPVSLTFYRDQQTCFKIPEFTLPIEVIECISQYIKSYWQEFARALQIIVEKEIDLIEEFDGDKTKKCLEIFVLEVQRQRVSNPYGILLSALEMIKRRDVKEKVENLLGRRS